ncbi:MAG: hypothetical protein KA523_07135 [Flavobacterium sp.]|nr:hypothetical protein [Flavobacterium sp.]
MNEFTKIMKNHSNDKLLEVLETRNKFQENAKIAAITEAIKRGLILDENDLNEKFPINVESKSLEEKLVEEGFLEFKKKTSNIFLIIVFSFCWIFFTQITISDKNLIVYWKPVMLSIMTIFCYKNYSKLFANVIVWASAVLLVSTVLSVIFSII